MKFDLTSIELSKNDLRRGLCLPNELNETLAEDIGIMVGDGHIGIHKYERGVNYQICVSCDSFTDREYVCGFILNLKKQLYGLDFPQHLTGKRKTEIRLQIFSKGLVGFYLKQIGLPVGRKDLIRVPAVIKEADEKIKRGFLRGFVDTDGGITFRKKGKKQAFYPSVKMTSASKNLIEDIAVILTQLGFTYSASYNLHSIHSKTGKESILHELELNGAKKVLQWSQVIGFSNPKNVAKVSVVKRIYGPGGI